MEAEQSQKQQELKQQSPKVQCRWTKELKRHFIDSLVEKLSSGNTHTDSGFKKVEWTWIENDFQARSGVIYNKGQLQSQYNILKKEYDVMAKLRGNSGFGWDNKNNVPTAPDNVWEDYLVHTPLASKFRNKGSWDFFEDLANIYDGQIATGDFAMGSADSLTTPQSSRRKRSRKEAPEGDDEGDNEETGAAEDDHFKRITPTPKAVRVHHGVSPNIPAKALATLETLINKKSSCARAVDALNNMPLFTDLAVRIRLEVKKYLGLEHNAEMFCFMADDERELFITDFSVENR